MDKTTSQIMSLIAKKYARQYEKMYKDAIITEALDLLSIYEERLDNMQMTIQKQKEVLNKVLRDKNMKNNELETILEIHIYK